MIRIRQSTCIHPRLDAIHSTATRRSLFNMASRAVLALLITIATVAAPASFAQEPAKEKANTISIVIDYGDGVEKHFTKLAWEKGTTVLAATQAAQKHARGIKLEFRGEGATAFVTKIDDLENEGQERNWLYRVNGKVANKSCGIVELSAGDVVLWRFQ